MKKLVKQTISIIILSITLIATIAICAYAATINATFGLSADKQTYAPGDVITLIASVNSIESPNGVDTLGGTIDFNRDYLTDLQIKGLDGWSNSVPANQNNGKFIIDYGGEINKTGQMLEIKLTVKKDVSESTDVTISLKDLTLARGNDKGTFQSTSVTVNINVPEPEDNTVTPPPAEDNEVTPPVAEDNEVTPPTAEDNEVTPPPAEDNEVTPPPTTETNETTPEANEVVQIENITSDKELPKTGTNKVVITIAIIAVVALVMVFYIRLKVINDKVNPKHKRR